ncbi:MAG: hypothetical protein J3Q66DRAFT_343452 [Benniella sp.]|nr:MAG: hypothetical protein J3Q66DRAFT_343452 [Benniella sp.]
MGILSLKCIVAYGARLLGMSYTKRLSENGGAPTHVVLVQSNLNPSSVNNLTWSLVAAWPRNLSQHISGFDTICHVDPLTGVFTAMSNYTSVSYQTTGSGLPYIPYIREPGGFQYDPRTDSWKEFTLEQGYRWGDVKPTFTLFNWPDSSALYHANIAQSAGGVNLGVLDQNSNKFVNVKSWTLEPKDYGYPIYLVAGKDALYHFGTIVSDDRTGAFQTKLTKILLSGDVGISFITPSNPPVVNVTSVNDCDVSKINAKYYKEMIYMFCTSPPKMEFSQVTFDTFLQVFDSGENMTWLSTDKMPWSALPTDFQPIGGDESTHPRILIGSSRFMEVYHDGERWSDPRYLVESVNITEPYGFSDEGSYPNNTPAITTGVVVGFLVVLGLLLFFLGRRYGPMFMSKTWPRWKKKMTIKIIEILEALRRYAEGHEEVGKGTLDKQQNKIEDGSTEHFELQYEGKILVTPEMDLGDLVVHNGPQKQEVESAQRQGSTDTATLSTTSEQDRAAGYEWNSANSSLALLPRAAPAPQSQWPVIANDHIRNGEAEEPLGVTPLTKKAVEPLDTMVMDEMEIEQLRPPLPPITIHEPSAPPLDRMSGNLGGTEPGSGKSG